MTIRCCVFLAIAATVSGCATGPSTEETQQVQLQLNALQQRIDVLEQVRHPGVSSESTTSEMSFGDTTRDTSAPRSVFSFGQGSASGAVGKLFRGGVNLVTGWVEIPKRVQETSQRSGIAAGLTWGLLRGLGYGFIRTAGGLYELVTFPVPAPAEYQPIMQPPFIF